MYKLLTDAPTLYVDVDDTLVFFPREFDKADNRVLVLNQGLPNEMTVMAHYEHIRLIKEFRARNFNVVVWSQGGALWAETIVKALGIEDLVDVIAGKPTWYLDDKKAEYFMPDKSRIWKKDEYKEKHIEEA